MSSKAEKILAGLGGAGNIVEIEPCITRLRTVVKDPSVVNEQALKAAGAHGVLLAGTVVQVVVGPAGTIVKLHPHAFAMAGSEGLGLLVHLGINTVRLDGAGFDVIATEGATVAAGDPIVSWNPAEMTGDDISTTVMIVALDRPAGSVTSPAMGQDVATGDLLFSVDA